MIEPLIDPEALETLKAMTEPAFLVELIDVYINDSRQLIDQMRNGIVSGEIETVRRAAHTLKSSSASLGAQQLANAARELEMIAKNGTLEGSEPKLVAIETGYDQLLPLLLELKNEF